MTAALFTASWAELHRHRDHLDVQPVRISRGLPKFWPEAAGFPALDDLMPDGWMLGIKDIEKFGRCYRRKLHVIGFDAIQGQLEALGAEYGRPPALACFEADPATCHRGPVFGFAAWWLGQCGEVIEEWEPANPAKTPRELFGQIELDIEASGVGRREE